MQGLECASLRRADVHVLGRSKNAHWRAAPLTLGQDHTFLIQRALTLDAYRKAIGS